MKRLHESLLIHATHICVSAVLLAINCEQVNRRLGREVVPVIWLYGLLSVALLLILTSAKLKTTLREGIFIFLIPYISSSLAYLLAMLLSHANMLTTGNFWPIVLVSFYFPYMVVFGPLVGLIDAAVFFLLRFGLARRRETL